MGISLKSAGSQREALRHTFQTYAKWYTDSHPDANLADLAEDQGKKYAIELYKQTSAIAPSESQISATVRQLGWHIPKKFKDGRLARGGPAQWLGKAYTAALKAKQLVKKRGRGAKAFNQAQEAAFKSQKPTLEQMEAYVIGRRSRARLFMAYGWLAAMEFLGAPVPKSNEVDPERGGAEIQHTDNRHAVVLWNATPGVETQNQEKEFVAKAIAVRIADMGVYIRRKMDEAARRFFRATS